MLGIVTWLNLSWTAAAFIGSLITFALLFSSVVDFELLRVNNLNSWRRYLAVTSILIFLGGFGTQLTYLIVGFISISAPAPPHVHVEITWQQYLAGSIFLFGSISSIVLAGIIFYRRHKILAAIEKDLNGKGENGFAHRRHDDEQ